MIWKRIQGLRDHDRGCEGAGISQPTAARKVRSTKQGHPGEMA